MTFSRQDLLSLANNDLEMIIARHIPLTAISHLSRFRTHQERKFAFRCFWVPFEMVSICEKTFNSTKGKAATVWQISFFLGQSRMLQEMRAWKQDPCLSWWKPQAAADACEWWMLRYDSYIRATGDAYWYWIKRRCPDSCHTQPDLAVAARYGFIQRTDVDGLPTKCLSEILAKMKEREQIGSRESEFFHKNANPKGVAETRWDYPEIDLWLIEIWPLVLQYNWTYKEARDVAFNKFGGDNALLNAGVLNDSKILKERCAQLGLQLSAKAQQRKGRPKKSADYISLVGFGEVYEQVLKVSKRPDSEVDSHGKAAFQGLAEIAVNIEPFIRLVKGTSKEKCVVVQPNLEMGGKKAKPSSPFFSYLTH